MKSKFHLNILTYWTILLLQQSVLHQLLGTRREFPPPQTILEIDCSKSSFPTPAFNSKRKQLSIYRQEPPHKLKKTQPNNPHPKILTITLLNVNKDISERRSLWAVLKDFLLQKPKSQHNACLSCLSSPESSLLRSLVVRKQVFTHSLCVFL